MFYLIVATTTDSSSRYTSDKRIISNSYYSNSINVCKNVVS